MIADEPWRTAPVYRHLRWTWSFHGLTLVHLTAAGFLATVAMLVFVVLGINTMWAIAVFLAALTAVAIVQWRRPSNYLPRLVSSLIQPHHLTPARDDRVTRPFPVACEELL